MAKRSYPVFVLSTVLLSALAGPGCQQSGDGERSGSIVQIGTAKAYLLILPAEYRALHLGMEKCLQRPVNFNSQPGGAAIGQQLEQGNIAFAILSAGEYAAIPDSSDLTLLASGRNALGGQSRKAYLVIKAGSHVKTISDCRGKRFAFGTHGDLLTDIAAQKALTEAGVPTAKLLAEILPPPLAFEGRLYLKEDVAKTIANDITVNAGVIDEITYSKMPETGGNLITGPSKDQFTIVGETKPIPEMVVVAGPGADPEMSRKLKDYLINKVKDDKRACRQLGVTGFGPADKAAYEAVGKMMARP